MVFYASLDQVLSCSHPRSSALMQYIFPSIRSSGLFCDDPWCVPVFVTRLFIPTIRLRIYARRRSIDLASGRGADPRLRSRYCMKSSRPPWDGAMPPLGVHDRQAKVR